MIKKFKFILLVLSLMILLLACASGQEPKKNMILATTTSTDQTGLLDALVPDFVEASGIQVKIVAVGTGQALEMGKNGEADVVLVHSKASEEAFVEAGYGLERHDLMYNDFVLLGNIDLPDVYKKDVLGALKHIHSHEAPFVSRGDDSGTHKKELALWSKTGLKPGGDWYFSAGKGMGEVLQMADEKKAYTLSDRGTYLSMKEGLDLKVVVEDISELINPYGVIVVNPDKNPRVHFKEAQAFVDWILSEEIQNKIGAFGLDSYGQPLFIPSGKEQ